MATKRKKSGSKSCTMIKSYKRKGKTVKGHSRKKARR